LLLSLRKTGGRYSDEETENVRKIAKKYGIYALTDDLERASGLKKTKEDKVRRALELAEKLMSGGEVPGEFVEFFSYLHERRSKANVSKTV
jgi:hypothetical protein